MDALNVGKSSYGKDIEIFRLTLNFFVSDALLTYCGPLAQLDRVADFESVG